MGHGGAVWCIRVVLLLHVGHLRITGAEGHVVLGDVLTERVGQRLGYVGNGLNLTHAQAFPSANGLRGQRSNSSGGRCAQKKRGWLYLASHFCRVGNVEESQVPILGRIVAVQRGDPLIVGARIRTARFQRDAIINGVLDLSQKNRRNEHLDTWLP